MSITVVYAGGWFQSFADQNSSPGSAIDHGTGSNRVAVALCGYVGGNRNTPNTFTVGADSFTAQGSTYTDSSTDKWRVFIEDLTVTGSQTPVLNFTGSYGGGGYAACAYIILQGDGALTIGNILAVLEAFAGGGGGDLFRGISGTSGDALYMLGISSDASASAYSGTLITSSTSGCYAVTDTSAGSSNDVGITVGAFGSLHSTGFSVTEGGGGGSTATAAAGAATVSAAGASTAATTATAAAGAATVSGVGGTLTALASSVFKNNTGTVLASLTDVTAWVYNPTTGALVVKLTGQTTDGSGVVTLQDAAIVTATTYRVVFRNEDDGAEGMETLTAS